MAQRQATSDEWFLRQFRHRLAEDPTFIARNPANVSQERVTAAVVNAFRRARRDNRPVVMMMSTTTMHANSFECCEMEVSSHDCTLVDSPLLLTARIASIENGSVFFRSCARP